MEGDKRFLHIATDPKFRRIPRTERKVRIDKRFKSMFEDEQFKVKYTVDKRGRPVSHTSNEDLKRYYELSSSDSSDSDSEDSEEAGRFVRAPQPSEGEDEQSKDRQRNPCQLRAVHKNDKEIPEKIKKKLRNLNVDYARGETTLLSESSSDDEESEDDTDEEQLLEHAWGELDRDAERTDQITCRLAACNMDWDRIRAVDLMVLLSSFLPPGGLIKSVTIYPSEFGLQRMKEEEIKGPAELVETGPVQEEEDGLEGSKYHMEKLRQYQLNRLKYFYAVIVCDNENTANKIYTECDGLEYESSATKMDLRFIPDDVVFDEKPKELCEKMPEQGKYQPRFFTTTALQQAKVNLTWDETNPERIEVTKKLASGSVDEIAEGDLQAYLASSSDDDAKIDEDEENQDSSDNEGKKLSAIDKYKLLLHDIENQEKEKENKDVEMEITWGIDLKNKTEKLVQKKLDEKEEKTPFQEFLDKRKEKKKLKREERKKKQDDQESDSDIPSDVDMNDPYFAEEFNKPEFKVKKKKSKVISDEEEEDIVQKEAELELLLMNQDDGKKHFSLKKIQEQESNKKSKRKVKNKKTDTASKNSDDNFEVNVTDERFSALYSSHHFNIDPTDPHYKKTKGMDAIVNEKLKRRNECNSSKSNKKIKNDGFKRDAELNVLVKSVKRKTEALSNKKLNDGK